MRIKGKYKGYNGQLEGAVRWLDPATGLAFLTETDLARTWTFRNVGGEWVSNGNRRFVPDTEQPDTEQPGTTAAYPDDNPKSLQGAKKYSLRYAPTTASIAMNQAFEDGARKYGAANWREKGVATSVYIDAALRHIAQYFDGGEQKATDSGVHNLGHAMACLAIIIDAEACGKLKDDRPFPVQGLDALLIREVK